MSQFTNGLIYTPVIQRINSNLFSKKDIEVSVLRLDLIHPKISGNKWFKLKYNLEEAKRQGCDTILTFGGAYSNHIHATAAACRLFGFKSIGVIGGEPEYKDNPTLTDATKMGMHLDFIPRKDYRRKNELFFLQGLRNKFGDIYIVPEGGNNYLGSWGCTEILQDVNNFDYVFCSVGTSATFCGLAYVMKENQSIIGVSVLKGEGNLVQEAQERVNLIRGKCDLTISGTGELLKEDIIRKNGIINSYHFGGFARHNEELLQFKKQFETACAIPLDYVYETKLFYAVVDLITKNKIAANSKITVIHGGGLQGNRGYENRYALNPSLNVNEAQG